LTIEAPACQLEGREKELKNRDIRITECSSVELKV
jgi:hypothetical protein